MPLPWSSTISQYIILQREKFQDNHISGLVFAPFLLPASNWCTMRSKPFEIGFEEEGYKKKSRKRYLLVLAVYK